MTKLRLVQAEISAKCPPRRKKIVGRKHVTPDEFEKIRNAARKQGRYPVRDSLLVTCIMSQAATCPDLGLSRSAVGRHHVRQGLHGSHQPEEGSNSGTHYLDGDEIRLLRALRREDGGSRFVFSSRRGGPVCQDSTAHHHDSRSSCRCASDEPSYFDTGAATG